MPKEPIKYTYKSFKSDKIIGDSFEIHCKKLGLGMKESIDLLFKFMVDNNISPEDLDYIWQKRARTELNNAKSELMSIHNLSVGFLRTFEKTQIAFWEQFKKEQVIYQQNLIENLSITFKNLGIQKSVLDEILYNTQACIMIEDDSLGKKISDRNWTNILEIEKKILSDDKA